MPNDALIGRNGGDEALVMLFGDSAQSIDSLMEGLVNSDPSFDLNGERYIITISVGYSWCDGSREDLAAAYSRADAALYSVKYNGKSGYRCYVEGMEARYRLQQGFASRNVADNLPEAVLVFQPETGEIMFANDATVELLDFADLYELMTFSQGTMMQLLHPDERSRLVEALEKQPEGKTRMQLRLLGKGGAEKMIAFSGKRVEMVNGKSAVYAVLFELD
jgi:PAS domain-containing protein